jgi:hypothetical protein
MSKMNERDFLNKIRNMKESGQSIKLTEMSDITPKESNKKQLLESYLKPGFIIEDSYPVDGELGDEEQGQDISPDEQRDEENSFKGKVTQLVEFEKIKVFTKTVTWSGKLVREGITWTYTLDDKVGCFIGTEEDDTLQLTDDMLEVIKNVRAYYDIWSEEWSSRLTGGASSSDNELDNTEGFQ